MKSSATANTNQRTGPPRAVAYRYMTRLPNGDTVAKTFAVMRSKRSKADKHGTLPRNHWRVRELDLFAPRLSVGRWICFFPMPGGRWQLVAVAVAERKAKTVFNSTEPCRPNRSGVVVWPSHDKRTPLYSGVC